MSDGAIGESIGRAGIGAFGDEDAGRMSGLHIFYFGLEGHVEAADSGGDAVFWWSGHAELHVVGDTAYEPWEKCGVRRVVVDGGLRRFDFPGAKHTGRGIFG